MLDVNLIRKEPERVREGAASKNLDPKLVDAFLELDATWRDLTQKIEGERNEQNKLSARFKDLSNAEKQLLKTKKEEIKKIEKELAEAEKEREVALSRIPNLPLPDVPRGKSEAENVVIRKWGDIPAFDFDPKDHLELGERLGLIDVSRAADVSGTRFAYLKGDAVFLEFALVEYALRVLQNEEILSSLAKRIRKGYSAKPFMPVLPPVMIRPDVFYKMARLEPQEERYYIPRDDIYLVGSAEHTLGPLHMGEALDDKELPLRYVGFSPSFRREAGSYGKDTRGILRVHQFDKLEIESFTVPEDSLREQDFIVSIQEYLMQNLKIPYRVVMICTGDMGGPDARQIDIESWMPGQKRYRETHTSDLMTDYQSRRLHTKVKRHNATSEFVHMNDATVFAIGRMLIAIIENYQTKEGKVRVPAVLQSYVHKELIG